MKFFITIQFIIVNLLFTNNIYSQEYFDLLKNEQKSIINATNDGGKLDDQIVYSGSPMISCDLNDNGLLDYIVSYPAIDKVYIFFDHLDFSDDMYYPHDGPNLIISDAFGLGSSFVSGDINGDGIEDLLIGAKYDTYEGEAFVIYGKKDLPTTGEIEIKSISDVEIKFDGFSANSDLFGEQVHTLDINNDGFDDIVVSAPGLTAESGTPGSIYIKYGSKSLPSIIESTTDFDIIIEGEMFAHIGKYLDSGDFNNDNFEDLTFTSPHWPGGGKDGARGKTWILYGGTDIPNLIKLDNVDNSLMSSFSGQTQSDAMAFVSVGDINGDMIDDLILSAKGYDAPILFPTSNNFGKIYINYGPISPGQNFSYVEDYSNQTQIYPHNEDMQFEGSEMYQEGGFGQSISTMDINGDGCDDLLIGSQGYSRTIPNKYPSSEGGAFIILGSRSLEDVIYRDSKIVKFVSDPDINSSFGRSVSFIRTNDNKILSVIADTSKNLIYLFDLSEKGLNLENIQLCNISLYPNPSKGLINIEIDNTGFYKMTIMDTTGKSFLEQNLTGNEINIIDISMLSKGIFIINIFDNLTSKQINASKLLVD